jgi:hypothetical protein
VESLCTEQCICIVLSTSVSNRCRQDNLDLEKKIQTQDWAKIFNLTLFGMCVVDAWLAFD